MERSDKEFNYTNTGDLDISPSSTWKCYLFGGDEMGIVYFPKKGNVPNWFIRFCMRICLGCKWVNEKKNKETTGET